MKFNQFIAKFDVVTVDHDDGIFVYSEGMSPDAKRAIFRLTDYKVSSHAYGSYFLIPV